MKVLLTATVQSHICQFHKVLANVLHEHGCEVHVAARDNLAEKNGLKLDFVDKVYDVPFARSPKSLDNLRAYRQLKKIIDEGSYDVIHCNTPMGGIVTRLAARNARKNGTKVFYTAHGFHFYEGAPIINWLLYYPIEKLFANRYTDKLLVISDADYRMVLDKHFSVPVFRIFSVGISSAKYHPRNEGEYSEVRDELGYDSRHFVGICTGELNKNKNQIQLLQAVPDILQHIPDFKLLLAGNGPQKENLEGFIKDKHLENSVRLLGYRTDLERYISISDVAISVSIREGLGINLIEAMACGKPVIGSDNRGHREFIRNGINGFIIGNAEFNSDIVEALVKLSDDSEFYEDASNQSVADAYKYYDRNVKKQLEDIYFGENT